jgi:hypothetical protein
MRRTGSHPPGAFFGAYTLLLLIHSKLLRILTPIADCVHCFVDKSCTGARQQVHAKTGEMNFTGNSYEDTQKKHRTRNLGGMPYP